MALTSVLARVLGVVAAGVAVASTSSIAFAQSAPTGAPPADAKAVVTAPTKLADAPEIEAKPDGTTVSLSAGGLLTTGNSRLLATSGNGVFETRFGANAIGGSVLGNYGQGAPPGKDIQVTTENIQGRLRYERYLVERASLFLINTGRHDRFQGLDLRYNLDPGFKYIFAKDEAGSFWGEVGYDFQYDVRRDDALAVVDDKGAPVLGADGKPTFLTKTDTDHSTRLFAGYKHAFNKEVTFASGIEYLQSFIDSTHYRVNFDALIAANIVGGLAFGFGFSARYDHNPLPTKEKLDTSSTVSLIFAFDNVAKPSKPEMCPCSDLMPMAPPPPSAYPADAWTPPCGPPPPPPPPPPPGTSPSPSDPGAPPPPPNPVP